MRTSESGLDYILQQDFDFIIWTGDNIDHYIWYQTVENQFFNQRYLKKYLLDDLNYTGIIYPTLGNHEGVPCDMLDPDNDRWIFSEFADIWIDYLTPEAHHNFSNWGFYHQKHPNSNMRIVSTFSLVYDSQNWYTVPNNTDPLGELAFLEETLQMIEDNGEVAYIIGHIPPGDIFTLSNWCTRFRALINRYTNIVRGQFYGHTHYDEFKTVKSFRDDQISAGVVWATGSFTAYPNKNPGLRIWEIDPETWHLWDYQQHRMYLPEVNEAANEVRSRDDYTDEELRATGEWKIAYTFRDYFGISMDFEDIGSYINQIKDNDEVKTKIITMMHGEWPDSIDRQNEQKWTY